MTQYTFPKDINEYVDTGIFIRADGSRALTGDWDIGAGRRVQTEEIRARSAAGLKLFDDGGSGLFVKDGGNVGIGTTTPGYPLEVNGSVKIAQNVGVGTNPSSYNAAGNEFLLTFSRTITDATAASVKRCIDNSITIEPAAEAAVYYQGFSGLLNIPNTVSYNLNGYVRGLQGICYHRANTTLNQMMGLYVYVGTYNGGSDSTGVISSLYGVYVGGTKTASSTLTAAYGLYITGITGTAAFDIYAAGTSNRNYLAGNVGIGTTSPTGKLDINSDVFRLRSSKTPVNAGDTGNAGDICWDSSYIYVCVATNTWKRAPLTAW